jgi:hypothetical protein
MPSLHYTTQWECLLKNLGEWTGSFTRISPLGEVIQDTPTITTLTGLNNNQTIKQTIKRFLPNQEIDEKVLEYSTLSRGILLFDNGAFSFGSMQWGPFSEFGAELGLIYDNERVRVVQLFNKQSQLDSLTLIREKSTDTITQERPELTLDQLLGEWQGEAVTMYPDFSESQTYPLSLKLTLKNDKFCQILNFANRTITSEAIINHPLITFNQKQPHNQILLLPNGVSITSCVEIKPGKSFFLEVGWLIKPKLRQRLIRSYNEKGEWTSLTLVTENKIT